MLLIHDRKLFTQSDTPEIAETKAIAKSVKVAICIGLAVAFICAEIAASIDLMQANAYVELTP
jgi:hypothetical protein